MFSVQLFVSWKIIVYSLLVRMKFLKIKKLKTYKKIKKNFTCLLKQSIMITKCSNKWFYHQTFLKFLISLFEVKNRPCFSNKTTPIPPLKIYRRPEKHPLLLITKIIASIKLHNNISLIMSHFLFASWNARILRSEQEESSTKN